MPRSFLLTLATLMAVASPLRAEDTPHAMHGHMHGGAMPADERQLVFFPPEMRARQLENMRDHLKTLDGIVAALAAADFDGAARLATSHLGLNSPSAAACKPKPPGQPAPEKGSMDEMMELYMPDQMRSLGLAMHTAASDFALATRQAAASGDVRPALQALSQVTQYCAACHAAFRLQ